MQKHEKGGMTLRRVLPWLVLACACAASMAFYALYGAHNLDADISSDMILADLLNQERNPTTLSGNWLYSTELRVVSTVPLYQLGLLLFASWHAAHAFAVCLIVLAIAASTVFMAREAGFVEAAPWLAALLVLPFSGMYAYIVLYGGCYAAHLALSFWLVGLVCRCGRRGLRRSAVGLILIALISLVGGLGGVRMLMMIIAPLFAATFLLMLVQLKGLRTFREGAHTGAVRMAAASAVSMLAAGAGYLYNANVFSRQYRFFTYDNMSIAQLDVAEYLKQLRRLLEDIGLRSAVPLFSQKGISSMLVLAYFAAMCFALWRLASRWKEWEERQRLFVLTGVIAVAMGMTLVILLQQVLSRYYIVGTIMLFALPLLAWEKEPCLNAAMRVGVFAAIFALFLFQSSVVLRYDYSQGKVNYEMAADWLLERGYTQGYATYWHANTLTEASDGQIEMWSLEDGRLGQWMNLRLHDILQRADHDERDPEGRVFLLVDENENKLDAPILDEGHLVDFVAWSYYVYEYESVDEMRALIAQNEASTPETAVR